MRQGLIGDIMDISDMKVAQVEYSGHWGDENDSGSDWRKLVDGCTTFSHGDACEFIVAVSNDHIDTYKNEWQMSKEFITYCRNANSLGFKYVCFYS